MRRCKSVLLMILGCLLAGTAITQEGSRAVRRVAIRDDSGQQILLYERSYALVIGNSAYRYAPSRLKRAAGSLLAGV